MAFEVQETYWELKIAHYIALIVSPILVVVGLAGNLISFLIFYPKAVKFTKRSSNCFLAGLAVFDSLSLVLSALRGFLEHAFNFDIVLAGGCGCYLYFNYLTTDMAVYIIICMTVDRTISVFIPFKAKVYCTRNRAIVSMCIAFLILTIINVPMLLVYHPIERMNVSSNISYSVCGSADDASLGFLDFVWPWIDLTVLSFIPTVLLVTLNFGILMRMRIQYKRVHAENQVSENRISVQRRTNILLFSICVVFFLSTSPIAILHIVEPYWSRDNDSHEDAIHVLVTTVTLQLLFLNNCLNFCLYCLSGREFRQDLKNLFWKTDESNYSAETTGLP